MTAPVRGRRRTAQTARSVAQRAASPCPTCGHTPPAGLEADEHFADLRVVWLVESPAAPGHLSERRFCAECQPKGLVYPVVCRICADGPMLAGALADVAASGKFPPALANALTARGWRPARDGDGWVCCA